MDYRKKRSFAIFSRVHAYWLLVLLLLFCASCTNQWSGPPAPTPTESLIIDPVFREFYQHLGGEEVLGPPISAPLDEGTARTQYVLKAKMVFDTSRSIRQRFTLAPLGVEMSVKEPPVPPPAEGKYKYDGGHVIGPEFVQLYEKLGAYVVGAPLTGIRYNPNHRRYEQFFESVGFYRLEGSDKVQLLDYGAWACEGTCRQDLVLASSPDASIDQIVRIDPTFVPFVDQWGADFTGFAISKPYLNGDGNWEQIFENVVLQANAQNDPTSVTLRPLTRQANIPLEAARKNTNLPDHKFYPKEGERGYEIPDYFWEFLENHGGMTLSGMPLTHLSPLNGTVLHQCFENLCLMYDPQAPPPGNVRPEPIGHSYKTLHQGMAETGSQPSAAPEYQINLWERYPYIFPQQQQEIGVSLMHNSLPVEGIQPTLVLTLLDGKEMVIPMPETDENGGSSLRLAPIQGPSGSLIQYQVCLPVPPEQETCQEDSFVLWKNP
jgi:hypothetical protein